jgi:hypothetical protein
LPQLSTLIATYVWSWALSAKTLDLSITIHLVVLEDSQLGLLALVLDLLWGSIDLLLTLLSSTSQTQDEMQGRLLLDVVVGKGAAVFELLASEDQALLVGWDALLVLDFGLDIVDGVGRLHLKGDSLAREGLDEAVVCQYHIRRLLRFRPRRFRKLTFA